MAKMTQKITETAIRVIAEMGAADAEGAWTFIKKSFCGFDLIAIVEGSDAGDEDALGCFGRMIRHYNDDVDRRFLEAS